MINGGTGKDLLTGDDGNDALDGGKGHDTLKGGKGRDSCDRQPGNDSTSGCENRTPIDRRCSPVQRPQALEVVARLTSEPVGCGLGISVR